MQLYCALLHIHTLKHTQHECENHVCEHTTLLPASRSQARETRTGQHEEAAVVVPNTSPTAVESDEARVPKPHHGAHLSILKVVLDVLSALGRLEDLLDRHLLLRPRPPEDLAERASVDGLVEGDLVLVDAPPLPVYS